jgi:streptomycin 6-kinase
VIDPKPHVGDPAYDPVQHILNCLPRAATNPEALVDRMASLTSVDAERLRLWLFVRCVQASVNPGYAWPEAAAVAARTAP